MNNRRRNFRSRPQKNNFRRRNGVSHNNQNGTFNSINGNGNFSRNSVSSNPFNLEKTINKFQQLAKDAQSQGDPVLVENYLQHADHFSRRLAEVNLKNNSNSSSHHQSTLDKTKDISSQSEIENKKIENK